MRDSEYHISPAATQALENYSTDLITRPRGKLVEPIDFGEFSSLFNRRDLIAALPHPIKEEDVNGFLDLARLTECATNSYTRIFVNSSYRFDARWLREFTLRVWDPDEQSHATPFKAIQLNMGFSEEELTRQEKEVQEMVYEHASGTDPAELTMFGGIQEALTDDWHGYIANIIKHVSPEAAEHILQVKRRESLHKAWYRDMTAIQVQDNPELVINIADTVDRFEMPGNKLVPHLQEQSPKWIRMMKEAGIAKGFQDIERRTMRLISSSVADNPAYFGKIMLEVAASKVASMEQNVATLPIRIARGVSDFPFLGDMVNIFMGQLLQQREEMTPTQNTLLERSVFAVTTPLREALNQKLNGYVFEPA